MDIWRYMWDLESFVVVAVFAKMGTIRTQQHTKGIVRLKIQMTQWVHTDGL